MVTVVVNPKHHTQRDHCSAHSWDQKTTITRVLGTAGNILLSIILLLTHGLWLASAEQNEGVRGTRLQLRKSIDIYRAAPRTFLEFKGSQSEVKSILTPAKTHTFYRGQTGHKLCSNSSLHPPRDLQDSSRKKTTSNTQLFGSFKYSSIPYAEENQWPLDLWGCRNSPY